MRVCGGFLLLLVGFYPVLPGCGRKVVQRADPNQPSAAEVEQLKAEKARLEKELQEAQAEKERLTAEFTSTSDTLAKKTRDLAAARAEVESLHQRLVVAPGNEELKAQLSDRVAAMQRLTKEVVALQKTKADIQGELDRIKIDQASTSTFITQLVSPLQGLWQADVPTTLNNRDMCKLFYMVEGVTYYRFMVCRDTTAHTLPFSYEMGGFMDLIKLPAADEVDANLNTHRRVLTHWRENSCPQAYLPETAALAWTKGNTDGITAIFAGDASPITAMHGDSGLSTLTCPQILERPERVGLEAAVAACRLFTDPDLIAKAPALGCFTAQNGQLAWKAQTLATRGP